MATMRLTGSVQLKNPMTSSRIESVTCRLLHSLNQLSYRVSQIISRFRVFLHMVMDTLVVACSRLFMEPEALSSFLDEHVFLEPTPRSNESYFLKSPLDLSFSLCLDVSSCPFFKTSSSRYLH
jgi:hypothetical protein